jgi:serine/threonine-protein kinase
VLTSYPPALDHLLDRALAKSPDDRYETAEDMAADIEGINDALKREHVAEILGSVKPLMEQEQWTSVRPVLLDLQRLNPQNTEVKKLLREVQEKVSRQQKTVQLRQLMADAEEAILSQRYAEALEFYNQAAELDRANPELAGKIENARRLKEKADKVTSLLEQSREARKRSDYGAAGQLIEQALQLDERNTDLRNERARIVQESERATKSRARKQFSDEARSQLNVRQYTEAIKNLRSALEIDPTDTETQQLYQDAVERQEEQRRRKIIEQIVAEISECIASDEYDRALALIQRAQERLPGEAVLLQLKAEAEAKRHEQTAKKLVEQTSLHVYNVFLTDPKEALTAVHKALEQVPGESRLIALEAKVVEQLKKTNAEELKLQYLKRAQTCIDAKQFDEAIHILETATIECGEGPDLVSLLNYARQQKRIADLGQLASNATREAQALIAASNFEAAIALLQPVALETKDASVEQLLRQASSSQAELVRRVDAVMSRAQALSEQDIEKALQLLSGQPREIQQNVRVRELIAKLNATKEQERLTAEAMRNAADALEKRDLRNGLNGLESVQRTYGDSPRLSTAIAEYKSKRAQIANQMVTVAIESATQEIAQDNQPHAAEALAQVADAAEFANSELQTNFKRLVKEAGKAPPKKQVPKKQPPAMQPDTGAASAKAKSGFPLGLVIAGFVVVVLGLAGAGYWFWFMRPGPVVPLGILELNATPFAEVVSVTSEKGTAVALPAGDHWTPMRFDGIPVGRYSVSFKGADGNIQGQQCDVAQTEQICTIELKPIDDNAIDKIVGGAQ